MCRYFQALEDAFLASAPAEMAGLAREHPSQYGEVYSSTWDAAILCHTERLLSVRRNSYHGAGGETAAQIGPRRGGGRNPGFAAGRRYGTG